VDNPTPAPEALYLGDGVYAKFDGYQIELFTEAEGRVHGIFLEPAVLESLIRFAEKVYSAKITIDFAKEP
jgi:hypothetical protein